MISRIALIVRVHSAVLVAWVKYHLAEWQEWKRNPLSRADQINWDLPTLERLPAVPSDDQPAVEVPEPGRHSKGTAA